MVQAEDSRQRKDVKITTIFFSNDFYFGFMLGLMDFSDIAILCNRPNNCCHQNLKYFNEPLFSLTLSGPGGGSEARMAKLTAANQKPLIL